MIGQTALGHPVNAPDENKSWASNRKVNVWNFGMNYLTII
jgi:hypothetical protein